MQEFICVYDDEVVGEGEDAAEAVMTAVGRGRLSYDAIANGEAHVYEKRGSARFQVEVE